MSGPDRATAMQLAEELLRDICYARQREEGGQRTPCLGGGETRDGLGGDAALHLFVGVAVDCGVAESKSSEVVRTVVLRSA